MNARNEVTLFCAEFAELVETRLAASPVAPILNRCQRRRGKPRLYCWSFIVSRLTLFTYFDKRANMSRNKMSKLWAVLSPLAAVCKAFSAAAR